MQDTTPGPKRGTPLRLAFAAASGLFEADRRAVVHARKEGRVADDPPDRIDVTGRTGLIRLESPTMDVIREGAAATGPWEETLEAANHLVTHLDTGDELELRLGEAAGGVDVEF